MNRSLQRRIPRRRIVLKRVGKVQDSYKTPLFVPGPRASREATREDRSLRGGIDHYHLENIAATGGRWASAPAVRRSALPCRKLRKPSFHVLRQGTGQLDAVQHGETPDVPRLRLSIIGTLVPGGGVASGLKARLNSAF